MSESRQERKQGKHDIETQLLCVAIIGYDQRQSKSLLQAVYPEFELSDKTLDGIFSMSAFSGNESSFTSLEVDEGVVMSYYTGAFEGLRCDPHCLVLFLDRPDTPERYKKILSRMGAVVFPLLCNKDFQQFARKLYETALLTGELRSRPLTPRQQALMDTHDSDVFKGD